MNIKGNNITIKNGIVTVDGVVIDTKGESIINVEDCVSLQTDIVDVFVYGNVSNVSTLSGDVKVSGSVAERVETMSGDVEVLGDVYGGVVTMSGDVNVG